MSVHAASMSCLLALLLGANPVTAEVLTADEVDLRRIKTEDWPRFYREQDVAGLEQLLHPSFEMIDASGARSTRAEELAYVAANKPTYRSFRFEIERLDIYPQGLAIVDGSGHVEQDTCEGFSYRSSNVLLKDDGRWRAVASHVSGVSPRKATGPDCGKGN